MSLIKVRKSSISNLGEKLSKFANLEADCIISHENVSAFGAPGECHQDVNKWVQSDWAELERKIGTFDLFMDEARKRIGANRAHKGYERAIDQIISKNWI